MTTAAQMRRLAKPLLERNSDLALVDRFIVIKPTRHVVRGIYLNARSWKNGFCPVAVSSCLCMPTRQFGFGYGDWIFLPKGKTWDITRADIEDDFIEYTEKEALPLLRTLGTIEKFLDYATSGKAFAGPLDADPWEKAIVDVALGDFGSAELNAIRVLEREVAQDAYRARNPNVPDWTLRDYSAVTQRLYPLLLKRDVAGLATQLHVWEAASAKVMKTDAFWEPSPFPFELQAKLE